MCGEGCDLDDQAAALEAEVASLQALIDAFMSGEGDVAVMEDIAALESRVKGAEAEIRAAEAAIADLCAPEATCSEPPDLPAKTPGSAMALGIIAIVGGAGYLALEVRRRDGGPSPV